MSDSDRITTLCFLDFPDVYVDELFELEGVRSPISVVRFVSSSREVGPLMADLLATWTVECWRQVAPNMWLATQRKV